MQIKEIVKDKVNKTKAWVEDKVEKTGKFLSDHPQLIIPIISGVGMLISGGYRIAANGNKEYMEHCRVQDEVTEEYFLTNHPLTNTEILELGERMIDGQTKGDALNSMGLLRNENKRK